MSIPEYQFRQRAGAEATERVNALSRRWGDTNDKWLPWEVMLFRAVLERAIKDAQGKIESCNSLSKQAKKAIQVDALDWLRSDEIHEGSCLWVLGNLGVKPIYTQRAILESL